MAGQRVNQYTYYGSLLHDPAQILNLIYALSRSPTDPAQGIGSEQHIQASKYNT